MGIDIIGKKDGFLIRLAKKEDQRIITSKTIAHWIQRLQD